MICIRPAASDGAWRALWTWLLSSSEPHVGTQDDNKFQLDISRDQEPDEIDT